MVDVANIKRTTLPIVRQQADVSNEPGEASLSPFDLWRRSISDWSFGAGQDWLDRSDSDRRRFRISKGIDPWTKGKLKLLPGTLLKRASANTNLRTVIAGTRVYLTDGTAVLHSTDLTTFTTVTGSGANSKLSLASDGYTVWFADGTDIYSTNRTISTATVYNTLDTDLVAYVKGRLMASKANLLYNVTSGTPPAALYTHPNADFVWTGFGEGTNQIYAIGFSGDKTIIYRTAVKADGTALDIPVVAGELPDGEIGRSIGSYLGIVFIGTDTGVRLAQADGNGDLQVGSRIPTPAAVFAFEGQDRFVWFTHTNYDGTSTGLSRMDLLHLTEGLAPAYATDLMATVQGAVQGVFTLANKRGFTVSGSGLWYEDTARVASGEYRSGKILYGLTERKVWKYLDAILEPVPVGATVTYQVDLDGSLTPPDTLTEQRYDIRSVTGEAGEAIISLNRATDTTSGPTMTRLTFRALPIPTRGEAIVLPLLLKESIVLRSGQERALDPQEEFDFLKLQEREGLPLIIQVGDESFEGFLDTVDYGELSFTADGTKLQGTATVTIRRFDS